MRIHLARHGQTLWNLEHRIQGRTDVSLTALGRAQALALREHLANEPIDAIYSSPLRRARETAAPTAAQHGVEIELCWELIEIGYGELEGKTKSDPDPAVRELWRRRKADPLGYDGPGAEGYEALLQRVSGFVRRIERRHARDTLLIVGHRASNRALLSALLHRPLTETIGWKQKNDCVLDIEPGRDPEVIEHRLMPATSSGGST